MISSLVYTTIDSPIGPLLLAGRGDVLCRVEFLRGRTPPDPSHRAGSEPDGVRAARQQLEEFFGGRRREFDLRLEPQGTVFQRRVWSALCAIPYGETISYSELARRIGNPRAVRAVGLANGSNPIPIIIPCHRVIGADGSLTGYGGGLDTKQRLLDLERRVEGRLKPAAISHQPVLAGI
jgi:methylated-DNA-[protein]-cysteine S-methyltransferase